jgi:predicted ferric reductase
MSPYLYPGRVESITSSIVNTLARRGGHGTGSFLKGWEAEGEDGLKYSWGLTGVDQTGNYYWVHFFGYLFLAITVCLLGLHIFNMFWKQMRHMSVLGDPSRQGYWKINQTTWWPWVNRYLLAAPFWRKRHNRGFQLSSAIDNGTLPGRWHSIILLLYVAFNVAFCLVLPWDEEAGSIVAALRGRSGTLSALNLVPTILFALRNNPLIPLLQVSYDDFNLFHRWAARITIVEALVHTLAWAVNTKNGGGWKAIEAGLRDEPSYTWGLVGTVAFTFLGIQAWSPFRHAFYETFLNIHRLMVVLALVGLYVHLEQHGLPQLPWMHIVIGMWCVEIAMRLLRIWYTSLNFTSTSHIKVEALPGEACRVTIDLKRPWNPRPGCHVHVYLPALNPLTPWTSHPFSVAWSPETNMDDKEMTLRKLESDVAPFAPRSSKQISLICRARTGLTRKMYERAAAAPYNSFTTWGAIEGPYGGHHSLDSYGTVLLFAGGVGITHQVMYLKHLVEGAANGTTATQKIVLIWTIPDTECLEWIRTWMDEILRLPGRKKVLRIKLFISRPKRKLENKSETVQMFPGRPNTRAIVQDEAHNRNGAMAVTICGSGAFADDVRDAARGVMTKGSVDFIEEAFTF